jgi:hypothetical protein
MPEFTKRQFLTGLIISRPQQNSSRVRIQKAEDKRRKENGQEFPMIFVIAWDAVIIFVYNMVYRTLPLKADFNEGAVRIMSEDVPY